MRQIEIDTQMLSNTIRDLDRDLSVVKNAINTTYENVRVLDTMWDGPANNAFTAQFASDYERFMQICKLVQDYRNALETAKKEYINGENTVSAIVDAIRI